MASQFLQNLAAIRDQFNAYGFANPNAGLAAASVAGAESVGGNPYAQNPGSGALGLFQDMGTRQTQMLQAVGGDLSNVAGQTGYAIQELTTVPTYAKTLNAFNDPSASLSDLQSTFITNFEAPGGTVDQIGSGAQADFAAAQGYAQQISGIAPSGDANNSPASSSGDFWTTNSDGSLTDGGNNFTNYQAGQQTQTDLGSNGYTLGDLSSNPLTAAWPSDWSATSSGSGDTSGATGDTSGATGDASGATGDASGVTSSDSGATDGSGGSITWDAGAGPTTDGTTQTAPGTAPAKTPSWAAGGVAAVTKMGGTIGNAITGAIQSSTNSVVNSALSGLQSTFTNVGNWFEDAALIALGIVLLVVALVWIMKSSMSSGDHLTVEVE